MSCSNCYNGCTEISSDKCVRYTGVNVPALGISTGDTLLYVEQQLISFLSSVLNGRGIKLSITNSIICPLIAKYLPKCTDFNLDDVIETIIKAVCDLQTQIDSINATLTTLNASYDVDCLEGVSSVSGTHDILQATIEKLCALDQSLTALILNVNTNYVKISEIDGYIASYLSGTAPTNKAYNKMVPYTVVEYYGSLSNYPSTGDGFNVTGAGTGYWEKVYLCNGLNSTPDKRGRVGVGVTTGMGGSTLASEVNPANPFNPTYVIGTTAGTNSITLTPAQIPAHTHPATAVDSGHTHALPNEWNEGGEGHIASGGNTNEGPIIDTTAIGTANITVSVQSNVGGGGAHANNQPALACYYIMYIP